MVKRLKTLMGTLYRKQFLRFTTVGGSGVLLRTLLLWMAVDLFHLPDKPAYIATFVVVVTSNYILNTLWTFRDVLSLSAWAKYIMASSGTFVANFAVYALLTSVMHVWYLAASVVAIFAAFALNYIIGKRYVWRRA